jgi:lysophospholipid acyltransferase (LPLAT)-like uncharacterized protein
LFKKKLFASWDRFIMPYPFCRAVFLWGDPIVVPGDAGSPELERKRLELEETLNRMTLQADQVVARPPA